MAVGLKVQRRVPQKVLWLPPAFYAFDEDLSQGDAAPCLFKIVDPARRHSSGQIARSWHLDKLRQGETFF
jgi:hypothetical protein